MKLLEIYRIQAKTFRILAHPTRVAILDLIRDGEQCVCHMEAMLGLRQAHISQHLMVLRDSGLVSDRRDGWNIFYQVSRPEIYAILDAMAAFDGVKELVRARKSAQKHTCPCPKCSTQASEMKGESNVCPVQRKSDVNLGSNEDKSMKIEILGTGCYNCVKLETLIAEILAEIGKSNVEIARIDDEHIIRRYMPLDELPGLVIDGVLACVRDLPDKETLKNWLQNSEVLAL